MATTWCGTVDYMPPEMLYRSVLKMQAEDSPSPDGTKPTKTRFSYDACKADVWSTGVLLFLLLNDDFPFGGNGKELEMYEMQNDRKYVFFNKTLTDGAKQVIKLHFEPDPKKRSSFEQILTHAWFDEDCWQSTMDDHTDSFEEV